MASKHLLQGLIKWTAREPWRDRFEQILEDHLQPTCDETGLEADDIVATVGEDLFISSAWACAFEDFLTREFDDGSNAIDDYLKRRGWKETASVRTYMAALRDSTMSLYEVSDIVRDTSFRARDLIRGGEPVLVSERSATRALKPWDRIAARVVQVGSRTQIGGGVLPFEHRTAEALIEALREFETLGDEKKQKLAEAIGRDFDDAVDLSPTEMLRALAPVFTTFWLTDLINRIEAPETPDLHNAEGDELVLCEVRYPLAADTTIDDIQTILGARPEFRPATTMSWNWVRLEKPVAASSDAREKSRESLTFETWHEDGALVLGHVELDDRSLVLAVNSRQRADTGRALLSKILGRRAGQPSVTTETIEQAVASRGAAMPQQLDIPEEERRAIIHDHMDRHYHDVLDQPVPMLGDQSPRAAVRTANGRIKVADWLKMLENRTAKSADADSAMANYKFDWLWTELGISELRR
ncbi:hypothetical protein ACFFWD_27540 [Bradyrhizobium erythrophlei]|uniref:hypothetical protein n=1 Tax=Bradyrhizobium erythrophlei TaxID=1437360 RepID=UPI0035E71DDA